METKIFTTVMPKSSGTHFALIAQAEFSPVATSRVNKIGELSVTSHLFGLQTMLIFLSTVAYLSNH